MSAYESMREAFSRNRGDFVAVAPDAYYSVSAIADIQQACFYSGAAAAFQVITFKAATKVERGMNPVQALTEAMDEVTKEITETSRAHQTQLLASLAQLKSPEDSPNG